MFCLAILYSMARRFIESIKLNFKNDFVTGLILLIPIFATVWVLNLFVRIMSVPVQIVLGQTIPSLLSFLISVLFITVIGFFGRNFVGKAVLSYVENVLSKIPVVNTLYKSVKQVVGSFSMQKENLAAAVLIEYPRKGIWCLGFVTKEHAHGFFDTQGVDLVEGKCAVFVPTTPNPTSGFFVYADRSELKFLDVSIEDSIKTLMSAGVISPDSTIPTETKLS